MGRQEAMSMHLDVFTLQFLETALWSSTDISEHGDMGEPLDENYTINDFDPHCLEKLAAECAAFQAQHTDLIAGREEDAGHDFWLTRCGHGAGFWDGDWPQEAGQELTKSSKTWGNVDLYTYEGKVYAIGYEAPVSTCPKVGK